MAIVGTVLASSVVAAVISVIASVITMNISYRNEYYKILVLKRFEVYGLVEEVLMNFNSCVTDPEDGVPYHIVFSDEEGSSSKERLVFLLHQLGVSSVWISGNARGLLYQLSQLILTDQMMCIDHGKKVYPKIGWVRDQLVVCVRKDLKRLYKNNLD